MTGLVVGGIPALFLGHHHRAAGSTHDDLVLGLLEILHVHDALVLARGEQRRLIDQVGQIGAGEAGRAAGDDVGLDVGRDRHLAHMHQEDLLAAADVGQGHHHLAVEAAGAEQRRIEHVGAVGGGDDDNAGRALEAVHLDQELVQGLLAFVVAAAQACAALAPDGVDLVDEDDARGVLLGLLEHVADARGADADEHFDEVRTGDGEERHLGFAGDGLGEQRLAGARAADHQHTAGNAPAELLELGRIAEELDQFGDVFLGLIAAGDIGEGDAVGRFVHQPRLALAEREGAALAAALHLAHEEYPDADQQQHREPGDEDAHQEGLLLFGLGHDLDIVLEQVADHPQVRRRIGGDLLALGAGGLERAALDQHLADVAGFHFFEESRVVDDVLGALTRIELVEDGHQDDANDHPDRQVFEHIIQASFSSGQTGQGIKMKVP